MEAREVEQVRERGARESGESLWPWKPDALRVAVDNRICEFNRRSHSSLVLSRPRSAPRRPRVTWPPSRPHGHLTDGIRLDLWYGLLTF